MVRSVLSRVVALALAGLLAGCGLFEDDDRAPWRAQAEAACFARGLVKLSSVIAEADEVDGRGACGLDRPLRVTALADGTVRIAGRPLTMSCPVTAALERWLTETVQPAALARYGLPVVELKSMGTYNCRTRNNRAGARLSEHAFANAIDVSGFVLADGRTVSVLKDWRGAEADRAFLRTVHAGACGPFTTVLGPGSDGLHENHLHLDLARHNAAGTYRYCRPKPVMPAPASEPMIMVDAPMSVPAGAWPRVLPETLAASAAAEAQPILPPPPAPVAGLPAPLPPDPAMAGPTSIEGLIGASADVPGCPPGYVCTPLPAGAGEPPPVGWQVGPQPLGYDAGDLTGDVTGAGMPYDDH